MFSVAPGRGFRSITLMFSGQCISDIEEFWEESWGPEFPNSHLANGPWKKSLNFIFPTKYVIPLAK